MTCVIVDRGVEVNDVVVGWRETMVVVCVTKPRRCSVTVTVGLTEGSCTR